MKKYVVVERGGREGEGGVILGLRGGSELAMFYRRGVDHEHVLLAERSW